MGIILADSLAGCEDVFDRGIHLRAPRKIGKDLVNFTTEFSRAGQRFVSRVQIVGSHELFQCRRAVDEAAGVSHGPKLQGLPIVMC